MRRGKTIAKEEHTPSKVRAFVYNFQLIFLGSGFGAMSCCSICCHTAGAHRVGSMECWGSWPSASVWVVVFSVGIQLSENLHTLKSVITSLECQRVTRKINLILLLTIHFGETFSTKASLID